MIVNTVNIYLFLLPLDMGKNEGEKEVSVNIIQ